jgi:hypothetical protein
MDWLIYLCLTSSWNFITASVVQWLSYSPRVRWIVGLSPGRVKPKTVKSIFAASPLSTLWLEKIDWLIERLNYVSNTNYSDTLYYQTIVWWKMKLVSSPKTQNVEKNLAISWREQVLAQRNYSQQVDVSPYSLAMCA